MVRGPQPETFLEPKMKRRESFSSISTCMQKKKMSTPGDALRRLNINTPSKNRRMPPMKDPSGDEELYHPGYDIDVLRGCSKSPNRMYPSQYDNVNNSDELSNLSEDTYLDVDKAYHVIRQLTEESYDVHHYNMSENEKWEHVMKFIKRNPKLLVKLLPTQTSQNKGRKMARSPRSSKEQEFYWRTGKHYAPEQAKIASPRFKNVSDFTHPPRSTKQKYSSTSQERGSRINKLTNITSNFNDLYAESVAPYSIASSKQREFNPVRARDIIDQQ